MTKTKLSPAVQSVVDADELARIALNLMKAASGQYHKALDNRGRLEKMLTKEEAEEYLGFRAQFAIE